MASPSARPAVLAVTALSLFLLLCVGPGAIRGNKLKLMLQKREAPAPKTGEVAVDESKAKAFLGSPRRQRRQLWDRTRPEVQQWYQQFLYMGFDEALYLKKCQKQHDQCKVPRGQQKEMKTDKKFEDDVTYWLNRGRNGHDYYDYHHRHYDEDAAIGPRSPESFRLGASVNYDDY